MPKSNNAGNLTPNDQRTPEQLKAMGAKGGKASAEARRKKKLTKQLAREVLALQPKLSKTQKASLTKLGYDAEGDGAPTVELMGLCAMAKRYMAGDQFAGKFLYEYAQIADLRTTLERERLKAAREQASKPASMDVEDLTPLVKLLGSPAEGEAPRE